MGEGGEESGKLRQSTTSGVGPGHCSEFAVGRLEPRILWRCRSTRIFKFPIQKNSPDLAARFQNDNTQKSQFPSQVQVTKTLRAHAQERVLWAKEVQVTSVTMERPGGA